jgi:hypothetical protein
MSGRAEAKLQVAQSLVAIGPFKSLTIGAGMMSFLVRERSLSGSLCAYVGCGARTGKAFASAHSAIHCVCFTSMWAAFACRQKLAGVNSNSRPS